MKLIILDYELGGIDIISNVPENIDCDFIDNLGYKDTQISWMVVEDDALITKYTYHPETESKTFDNENLFYDRS